MEAPVIKSEVIDNIKVEDKEIGDKTAAAQPLVDVKHKLCEDTLKLKIGEIKTEDDENDSSSNKKMKFDPDYHDDKDDEELEEKKPEDDPYAYIKLGHFTCEIYKMELGNLPRFISYTCLKKLIEKNCKVKPHKIKVIKEGNKPYSFISFKSADDRDKAIGIMNGLTWKKQKLYAKRANPAKDPLIKKRLEDDLSNEPEIGIENIADAGERLNDKICPLWKTPYDEQLKIKAENYLAFLISLRKDITHLTETPGDSQFNTIKWANEIGEQNNGSICPIGEIKPSPVTSGYRNKCEFSIGPGKIVGFRLGLYKEGSLSVITPPENCPIVSPKIRNIVLLFQDYLQTGDFDAFNNVTHEGVWRQLTVRSTELGAMLIIAVHPQAMSIDRLEEEKKAIKDYFTKNQDKCTVTSLFFHPFVTRDKTIHDSSELQLIDGEPFILESMKNGSLTMKISPFAFFQTNTKAAEVCYQTIEELASLNESSVVLDICCGTGSIGIYLAGKVKHVIGLELNHDALKDARYNVEINKITNIEFIEGKAEDVLDSVIQRAFEKFGNDIDLTAIIDPPRPGLHPSVIKTIRATANIKKLVYVSCEPKLARKNLIDLSRPKSNSYKGIPFVPTLAIPIDMFPHTTHCELLLLYQRMDTLHLDKCS